MGICMARWALAITFVLCSLLASVTASGAGGGDGKSGKFGSSFSAPAAPANAAPAADAGDDGEFKPTTVSAVAQRSWANPGGDLVIAVILKHKEGWHSWPALPSEGQKDPLPKEIAEFAQRTEIGISGEKPAWVATVGATQYPELHEAEVSDVTGKARTVTVPTYGGEAVAFVPVLVSASAPPGEQSLEVRVFSQSCDKSVCVPAEEVVVKVAVTVIAPGAAAPAGNGDPALFAKFDPQRLVDLHAGKGVAAAVSAVAGSQPIQFNLFWINFSLDPRGAGFVLLLVVAFLGGILLNFTPCVLPVIPLKILSLSHAAGNPRRCLYLGTVMSIGVVFFWMVLGVLILTISGFTAISSLFSYPPVILGIGAFILFMSLGMFGVFTVNLPQGVYMLNPKHETTGGSFVFGILTAILATPCTAPLMGTAAAWAAQTGNPGKVLSVFGAIGAGMAVPYLILAANPKLLSKLPSAGPGSELLKQVMGGLMIGVALFFLGTGLLGWIAGAPWIAGVMWWSIAATASLTAVWMVVRGLAIARSNIKRTLVVVFGLLLTGVPVLVAVNLTRPDPIPWQAYEPAKVADHLQAGRVVVIDFTADWCLNCKALEQAVLHRPEVVKAMNQQGIVPVKADVTSKQAPGWAKLKELKQLGIPLLVVVRNDGSAAGEVVFMSNAYTPQQVIDAIEQARGTRTAARGP